MIIYNVTINVDDRSTFNGLKWMQNEHIPAVLSTSLFTGYRMCRLLEVEDEGTTYSIQYSCNSLIDITNIEKPMRPSAKGNIRQVQR